MVSPVRVRVPPLLFCMYLQVKLSVILIHCQIHCLVSSEVSCVLEGAKPLEGSSDLPESKESRRLVDSCSHKSYTMIDIAFTDRWRGYPGLSLALTPRVSEN